MQETHLNCCGPRTQVSHLADELVRRLVLHDAEFIRDRAAVQVFGELRSVVVHVADDDGDEALRLMRRDAVVARDEEQRVGRARLAVQRPAQRDDACKESPA